MMIKQIVTFGFSGGTEFVPTLGFGIGEAIVIISDHILGTVTITPLVSGRVSLEPLVSGTVKLNQG